MARLPYPEPEPGSELAAIYADIAGLRGRVLNLNKALGNQPAALRAFMALSRHELHDCESPVGVLNCRK